MPTGEHMKGKTNNPNGRPVSPYVPPTSKKNKSGVWEVPAAERIFYDLQKVGGNLDKLLELICNDETLEESLLVAIMDELEQPGNEMFFSAWNELIEKNEKARLILLEQNLLEKLEDGKKFGASEVTALKFLFQTRLADRYNTKKKEVPTGQGTATPDQMQLAEKLAKLVDEAAPGVGK